MNINGFEVTFKSYLEIAELFIDYDNSNQEKTKIITIIPKFNPEDFDLTDQFTKIPNLKLSREFVFEKAIEEIIKSRISLDEWNILYVASRNNINNKKLSLENDKTLDKIRILIKK